MFTLGNLELKNEWLNTMILNKALSGHSDCNGPVTINWRFEESFVFSLIEEYTGKWWYRLFVCNDSLFHYSFEKILHPSPDAYNMKYVYDYYFDYKGHERKLLRFVEGDWVFDVKQLAFSYFSLSRDQWYEFFNSDRVVIKPYWLLEWEKWKSGKLYIDISETTKFDMKEIVNPDIRFVTKEDAAIFWAIILSELDVRIGEEISKNLTDSQLKEYDDLIQRGNGEGGLWLERNLPEYKQIVSNKKIEMKREIDAYKSII